MGNIFAGSEIVELGIQIEKNGRDFYGVLAQQIQHPQVARLFGYLAGEEEKHIAVFRGILASVEQYQPQGMDADQYYAYMNSLASEYVFTQNDKGKALARTVHSNAQALDLGIRFEKDSILFYEGMKKAVPRHEQTIVDELIAQEQNHLQQLTDLKKTLP
jgi:rubrerythrin